MAANGFVARGRHRSCPAAGFALIALSVAGLGSGCPISLFPFIDPAGDTTTCRCDRNVQISIETRFVTVSDSFLRDIGVDLDTTLQTQTAQPAARSFLPASITNDPLGLHLGIPGTPTGDAVAGLTPTQTTSTDLSLLSTVIDASRLNSLLAAVAAQQDARILTGPTITVRGGESAFITVANEQRFISDVNATFTSALAAIDPLIPLFTTGPSLEVESRGLQDNQDLALTLRPSVGGTFNTPDVTGNRALVQLAGVQTTVLVPDGHALVLGGVLNSSTIARTPNVLPWLGDVPIIGRLFDNRVHVKDDTNLVILITPRLVR